VVFSVGFGNKRAKGSEQVAQGKESRLFWIIDQDLPEIKKPSPGSGLKVN